MPKQSQHEELGVREAALLEGARRGAESLVLFEELVEKVETESDMGMRKKNKSVGESVT